MPKDVRTFVLPMAAVVVAVMTVAPVLLGANQESAFVMVVARDARERIAQRALKGFLVFASPTEVGDGVSIPNATRGLKEARCFARLMGVGNVVRF